MLSNVVKQERRIIAEERDLAWHLNKDGKDADILGKRLLRFEREQQIRKPVISEPVKWLAKKFEKLKKEKAAREQYEVSYGPSTHSKLLIDCARKQYNHYEGMRYPTTDIPLVSEFWAKNKYKDDWFVLRRSSKNPSFDAEKISSWVNCAHLLNPSVVDNILSLGFQRPTIIQARALSAFKSMEHLFIAAETGSGKTLAYAAPLVSEILKSASGGRCFKAVVLVLSNELRIQTKKVFDDLVRRTNVRICSDRDKSTDSNKQEWDVFIGTAGMVRDVMCRLTPSEVKYLIIDEADMLLDDSFVDVMSDLLARLRIRFSENDRKSSDVMGDVRVVFASATCPPELQELAEGIVPAPHIYYVQTNNLHALMSHVEQKFIRVRERDKVDKLQQILRIQLAKPDVQTLVFCKDKRTVQFVSASLASRGIETFKIGDAPNEGVEHIARFRILVATDRASRGLDLPMLNEVVNYDFPRHMIDYIHRAGRVGRVGSRFKCRVTSFVRCPWEVELVNAIETAARFNTPIEDVETNVAGMLKARRVSD
ncbi:unnamed protein product [Toxocara canis]|uniref:ATP-dependent RNA helicase n=1 Tax=Toxocara canis TaxID=6265 RepID=A0A183UFF4_TOXCA|nr:unnamed protein product [Toxocara canis]